MKILFIARHNSGDNDDEGAIAHALTVLGHQVLCIDEVRRKRPVGTKLSALQADCCLFLKWPTISELAEVAKNMPCYYWHFDMIRSVVGDPTLEARSQTRIKWCQDVLPYIKLGFHTDGDWVAEDKSGKLRWLTQGMDERVAGRGTKLADEHPLILFTGMVNHGQDRASHVAQLKEYYGVMFGVLGDGGPKYRKHGRDLADIFASTRIVIAPDGPQTQRYWSNRVYLTLGLGGFLLHPYCDRLGYHYDLGEELITYQNREELIMLIDHYLIKKSEREVMIEKGLKATLERNLYRHRCEDLIKIIQESIK